MVSFNFILKKIDIFFTACRAYSIPVSFMSWLVPFLYALLNDGNIKYGILSLFGIIILHLGTNIFDDAVDYTREILQIKKGIKNKINLQKGKCICILNGSITLKQAYIISFCLFSIALIIGLFFLYLCGLKLLYIIIPCAFICILYPLLGGLGLGEILVSLVFSPFIYAGVYYIIKGNVSPEILILSVSTGLLSVAVLHNHMLLDYKYDTENKKITLCRLCGSEKKALFLLGTIVSLAYINLIFWVLLNKINCMYLLPLITIPNAYFLIKVMNIHIKNPDEKIKYNMLMGNINGLKKAPEEQKNFLLKFFLARNLLSSFTFYLCIAIVICKYTINN